MTNLFFVLVGDDEFGVPEDPIEQERFKRRLIATARSLKKKQQQLQADQDLLADRWTEVVAAEEYGLEPPSRGYPKHKPLEEEVEEPEIPAQDEADRPPRGRDKTGYQAGDQPAPPRRFHHGSGEYAGPARHIGKQCRTTKIDLWITGARHSS